MPFYLQKSESIPEGLRRIASEQIGKALDEVADDALALQDKVHSLRKRCKKMRGLLRLPKPLMCEAFEVEDQRFREAGKLLAEYRDTQVFAKTIESLGGPPVKMETSAPVSTAALEQAAEFLAASLTAVPDWPLDLHGFIDIGPGFARTYRKCVEALSAIAHDPTDENFHKLRKCTKYHWYHVRIIERINKRELRTRRTRVHKLQLLLGKAHDLYALQAAFASQPDIVDAALLQKADALKHELYEHAVRLAGKTFKPSVDELVARCASRWVDWLR